MLLQTIKIASGKFPNGIAIDSDGNLLYLCGTTRTINKVKNGQIEVLITLQGWVPLNLCVTSTADILVTMRKDDDTQSKIIRYSGSTEKQTIQFGKEGKHLYSANATIKFITENRNHDICVTELESDAVVVLNQDGNLKWRYHGQPSINKSSPFKPCGITTDSQRHILIADCNIQCIFILDHKGQFLSIIDNCFTIYPYCVCVDNNDNLFVTISNGFVKKIKYLQ